MFSTMAEVFEWVEGERRFSWSKCTGTEEAMEPEFHNMYGGEKDEK